MCLNERAGVDGEFQAHRQYAPLEFVGVSLRLAAAAQLRYFFL